MLIRSRRTAAHLRLPNDLTVHGSSHGVEELSVLPLQEGVALDKIDDPLRARALISEQARVVKLRKRDQAAVSLAELPQETSV